MKNSEFSKALVVEGNIKTVTGKIIVTMNYATKEVEWNNPSTHDVDKKNVYIHKIEAYIDSNLWWKGVDLRSENIVLSEVERCKKQMLEEMNRLANELPEKTFAEKFKEI